MSALPTYATNCCTALLDGKKLDSRDTMVCKLMLEYAACSSGMITIPAFESYHKRPHRKKERKTPVSNQTLWELFSQVTKKLQDGWQKLPIHNPEEAVDEVIIVRPRYFHDEDSFYTALLDLCGLSNVTCYEAFLPDGREKVCLQFKDTQLNNVAAFFTELSALYEICIDIAPIIH